MPICEGCGSSFEDSFQFCPHCGRVKEKKEPIEVVVSVKPQLSGIECPRCHHDDKVAKVTVLIHQGTHVITGKMPVTTTHYDSDGHQHSTTDWSEFSGTQKSDLALLLSPPQKPSHGWISIWNGSFIPIAIFIGLISISPIVMAFQQDKFIYGLGLFLLGLVMMAVAIGVWKFNKTYRQKAKEALQPKMDIWNHAMSRWEKLYYCSRDDCVYIPGENESASIHDMNELIHK